MSLIKQKGTYRGIVTAKGVTETANGHIQVEAALVATECYDPETEQWIEDWQNYDEEYGSEITAYLVIFSKDTSEEPFFHAKQLQKAWGWSGEDLEELVEMEVLPFQFRIDEDTYKGKTRLKVGWIDAYDAEPGRTVRSLDSSALKKLNARYANVLRKLSGGPKPKSVPVASPTQPVTVQDTKPAPESSAEDTKVAMKAANEEKKKRGKAAVTKAKKTEAKKPVPPKVPKKVEKITQQEAWDACCAGKPENTIDDQLANYWLTTIEEAGGDEVVEQRGLWAQVRDVVLKKAHIDQENVPI